MSAIINVVNCGNVDTIAKIDFKDFASCGNAEPTSRVLDGSSDHGAAEEWGEAGHIVIDGEKLSCRAMYIFDDADITDIDGAPLDASDYPFNAAHVARIRLD